MKIAVVAIVALTISLCATARPAFADDSWNPFRPQSDEPRPPRRSKPTPDTTAPVAVIAPGDATGGPSNETLETGRETGSAPQWQGGPPASSYSPPGLDEAARGVERGELAPVMAADGSGLPFELWRGLDVASFEGIVSKLDIPPRSPTLHGLWRRLLVSEAASPGSGGARFDAVRAEALYRSGLTIDAASLIDKSAAFAGAAAPADAALTIVAAKVALADAKAASPACERLKPILPRKAELPKLLQRELLVLSGACAAIAGNTGGAGLAAELLREEISRDPKNQALADDAAALAALDAAAAGSVKPELGSPAPSKSASAAARPVFLVNYRLLALARGVDSVDIAARGEPALVAAIARDPAAEHAARIVAAESAARFNALPPRDLAQVWRTAGASIAPDQLLQTGQRRPADAKLADAAAHRAALFKAAEAERSPLRKVRLMRALADDAKRSGLYWQALESLGPLLLGGAGGTSAAGGPQSGTEPLQPVPELGWFAETAIEIALISGNPGQARQWASLGGAVPGDGGLRHWLPLIDLVDPNSRADRGRNLAAMEDLAVRGRLSPDLLHRLATVLDAHDVNVPIPLWEAVSKVPQPAGGHLPDTGVLSELQDAAKKREFGRTVLLAMRTLGPNGAEGANIIALGDALRALRRAGLETDASRIGLEALFAQWPRGPVN